MRTKSTFCLIALMGVIAFMSGKAMSDDKAGGAKKPSEADMQAMMQKCMELGHPGEHHKTLEQFEGKWNAVTKMWMDPSSPAMESKGTCERHWILDKRFLQENFKSTMMMPGEKGEMQKMPFEGIGTMGYDNFRNMYVSSWVDSMGTGMFTSKGSSADGKTFTYYGEMDEPMLNVVGRTVKFVTKVVDKDKHIFEMYDLHAGDGYKVMEITYTRQ